MNDQSQIDRKNYCLYHLATKQNNVFHKVKTTVPSRRWGDADKTDHDDPVIPGGNVLIGIFKLGNRASSDDSATTSWTSLNVIMPLAPVAVA